MATFLFIILILACALLVVIILAQNPKGGGVSSMGSGASQFLGARQAADFLEKMTWYFGVGIIAVVVFAYFLTAGWNRTTLGADGQPVPSGPVEFKINNANGYVPSGLNATAPAMPAPQQPAGAEGQAPAGPQE